MCPIKFESKTYGYDKDCFTLDIVTDNLIFMNFVSNN